MTVKPSVNLQIHSGLRQKRGSLKAAGAVLAMANTGFWVALPRFHSRCSFSWKGFCSCWEQSQWALLFSLQGGRAQGLVAVTPGPQYCRFLAALESAQHSALPSRIPRLPDQVRGSQKPFLRRLLMNLSGAEASFRCGDSYECRSLAYLFSRSHLILRKAKPISYSYH